jgi:hypothetical protein
MRTIMRIKSALFAGALTLAVATLPTAPVSAMPKLDSGLAGAETLPNIEKAHWHHRHWHRWHHHHWRHWHHHHWRHRHWHYY